MGAYSVRKLINRLIDIEDKLTVARGERWGGDR